jgi:hypothetical protein
VSRLIVSLTTIPSRQQALDRVLDSLVAQTYQPDAVCLCLPRYSKRFDRPYVEPEYRHPRLELIKTDHDWGPATKLLPVLQREQDPGTVIVTADDDIIYEKTWLERLASAASTYPDCAVGFCGYNVDESTPEAPYRLVYEEHDPARRPSGTVVSVLEGYRGVAYRRGFFNDAVFDYTWATEDAFCNDDVWLSGHLALRGVRKRVVHYRDDRRLTPYEVWSEIWQRLASPDPLHLMPRFGSMIHEAVMLFDRRRPGLWKGELA